MSAFASTLATQDGLCELKTLFKDLNTKIDKQNEEILNLKESVINQDLKISLEDRVGVLSASVFCFEKTVREPGTVHVLFFLQAYVFWA